MGRAESGGVSTETDDGETGAIASGAYISPLVDFLLLFVLTVSVAVSAVVVL